VVGLLPDEGREFLLCQLHRTLGKIYRSKVNREKAVYHLKAALGIASTFNFRDELFEARCSLAMLFSDGDEFDEANAHIKQATSHAVNDAYSLARAMRL
jgi:hypothetical protein